MNRFSALLVFGILGFAGSAFAQHPIDAAIDKLQADQAILKADLASNRDKATLDADKKKIKADQAALKAARHAANLRDSYRHP
jgi:NAD(P)H-hydrate repair Nnr-like enzyme with NAD(P)H-hydrate epimerase domain